VPPPLVSYFRQYRPLIFVELNYFEAVAIPRTLDAPDDALIPTELFEQIKDATLLCQICSTVYDNPTNVRSCLHKFCSGCIEYYN
jgi:hypothetical protein